MKNMTVAEAVEKSRKVAEMYLAKDVGEIPGAVVVVNKQGDIAALPYFNGPAFQMERHAIIATLKDLRAEGDFQCAVLISEAWMSKLPEGAKLDENTPRPSQDPNRVEVVIAHAIADDGSKLTASWPIIRGEAGPDTLGANTLPADHAAASWIDEAIK